MPIVEQLIERVREACAKREEDDDYPCTAETIRTGRAGGTSTAQTVFAGLAEIAHYFEDYEEVEVDDYEADPRHYLRMTDDCWFGEEAFGERRTVLLKPAPEPEPVTVTRETLARLAEFYEDSPDKSNGMDAAHAEAKELLGGKE